MSDAFFPQSGQCAKCGCTDTSACHTDDGPCHWVNDTHTLCSACVDAIADMPVYFESLAGSLIDSARISVMASLAMMRPEDPALVLTATEETTPTVHDCLEEAMRWLDAARSLTIERMPKPPTSLHVIETSNG